MKNFYHILSIIVVFASFAIFIWLMGGTKATIEDVLNSDTSQVNHSEIKVQELSETYLYYRQLESEREYKFDPKYLNND